MKRRVFWSPSALADVREQVVYIAESDVGAARRVAARIRDIGNRLGQVATGHPGRMPETYEKSVKGLPYIIAYALADGDKLLSILRVIHTARDWGEGNWP